MYVGTLLLCAACALSVLLIPLMRSATRRVFARCLFWEQPVLIFGDNGEGAANYQFLNRNPRLGLRPVGFVGQPDWNETVVSSALLAITRHRS